MHQQHTYAKALVKHFFGFFMFSLLFFLSAPYSAEYSSILGQHVLAKYSIKNLVKEESLTQFKGGTCLVLRLCVDDYHRYHAFDNYEVIKNKKIKGVLHTVNPISYENYQVFTENQREVSLLKTENFKEVYQIEVGALNVGKIHNHKKTKYKRYEERGYFSFGGSTIILLFQKDIIKLDEDIEKHSKENIEVKVEYGDIIGVKYGKR